MIRARRPLTFMGAFLILAALLPLSAAPVAAAGATVPDGFQDEAIFTGLDHPMAIAFAPNGKIFVAEKRGTIQVFDSLTDTTPTLFADLSDNVDNYWDRGLMGLAVDPGFATGRPYVYVLYAYNHILGDPPGAKWPSDPNNSYNDRCPSPPGGATDGCVISGRLSKLTANGDVMTGSEQPLIEDWCQQFPSHSLGALAFGADGALYASGGEGASFNGGAPDYGQLGGSLQGTPTPMNPCGDPGGDMTPPNAEGGALRSQDIRTPGDPTGLSGTIIRVDPDTGAAWPANANAGNADANAARIIAYGLRNPFRFTIKPGTNDVWVGDVGFMTWEEINHVPDPNAAPLNFGWPCYEGDAGQPQYQPLGLSLCTSLSAGSVTAPYYTYNHSDSIVAGDGCGTGSSSIAGLAFLPSSSSYPSSFKNGLFFNDYTRKCIWFMPAGPGGNPDVSRMSVFANLASNSGGAVSLTVNPSGDLMYADYDRGEVRRIHYYPGNQPPVAAFTATPSFGNAPLHVSFDAHGSSDADGGTLTYQWDLNGDGLYDDATGVTVSRTYSSISEVTVGLKVTDSSNASDTISHVVSVGNSPPSVVINVPPSSLTWEVGQTIDFSATATDTKDGTLPDSAFEWTLKMRHCPSNCHTHIITSFSGVSSGSFDAPDHEYPSHLELTVTVTDSGGLTATKTVELYPKIGTVAALSSPLGIPLTVAATTAIVGSSIGVTAPQTATLGEGVYTFSSWSDGGDRSHAVTVVAGPTTVTANYDLTGVADRSDTCAGSPAAVAPSGVWTYGLFAKANDVDWYRFKLTTTTRMRLALGDLTTGGRLDLYRNCSTLLQTSDRAGNAAEEIIRSLPAGTYAVKLSGSGDTTTPPNAILIRKMPNSVHVMSSTTKIEGNTLRLIGELYNNTTRTVGPVKVTARLYNAANGLLATRTAYADLSYMPATSRAPFRIVGSLPAGFNHASFTVSAPVTTRRIGAPIPVSTTNGLDGAGHWHVAGTIRNPYTRTVTTVWTTVTLYDGRGNILDATRAKVGRTTLGAGKSTTFIATFNPTGLAPNKVYVRGMFFR